MSVLEKTALILDAVAEADQPATLTSIAKRLGQPRSSVHRVLSELVRLGLLLRTGAASYTPGPRLARWSSAASGSSSVVRVAHPIMVQLRDQLGESVHLYVRQRESRVCIDAVEGLYQLRFFVEVGRPMALRAGAAGKLLLAFAEPALQAREFKRAIADPVSDRAPNAAALKEQLATIVRTNWSVSFGEREAGVAAAAVPVRGQDGQVVAALCISGPDSRLDEQRLTDLRQPLASAAADISRLLGWSGNGA